MQQSGPIYLHSPLCEKTVEHDRNKSLLLQFILSELLLLRELEKTKSPPQIPLSPHISLFPYDWANDSIPLSKLIEHSKLLPFAFPSLENQAREFQELLILGKSENLTCYHLFQKLQPFLIACNQSENLVFYLLKNGGNFDQMTLKTLLKKMYPNNGSPLSALKELKDRGFHKQTVQLKSLISQYVS